jgi:transposase-like protein
MVKIWSINSDKGPWYPEAFQALGLKWEHFGPIKEKANLQNQTLHKALRPMVQLHKTTPNTKKTTSNTHNLTVSLLLLEILK